MGLQQPYCNLEMVRLRAKFSKLKPREWNNPKESKIFDHVQQLAMNYFSIFVHHILTIYIIETNDSETLACIRILLKHRFLGPNSGDSNSISLERGLRICTSRKFSGGRGAGGTL